MNSDLWIPIVTISGISIASGFLLSILGKRNDERFDERQLIERGRSANLAMWVGMTYMLCLYMGLAFDLIRMEDMTIFAIYGLCVTMLVFGGSCIFHDAYLNREQSFVVEVLRNGILGVIWLVLTLPRREWFGAEFLWINAALALTYLLQAAMLLLHGLICWFRDRREEGARGDGEE